MKNSNQNTEKQTELVKIDGRFITIFGDFSDIINDKDDEWINDIKDWDIENCTALEAGNDFITFEPDSTYGESRFVSPFECYSYDEELETWIKE